MKLEDLGYSSLLNKFKIEQGLDNFEIGRVVAEHKERYIVKTVQGEYEAEITGNMRFTAQSREDFPAVGDWVALATYDNDFAIIHKLLPRKSIIKREAVAQFGEMQIIAVNVDCAFIVMGVDLDFNINRIERYLTICNASKVEQVILLSKIDLIAESELKEILNNLNERIKHIPIIAISNQTYVGYKELNAFLERGKTYCLLGSSGVGKSSLLNNLSGKTIMKTGSISLSTKKGRHVTSHRELDFLENGAMLIDNPGMREIGIADAGDGLELTFDNVFKRKHNCKFKDCTHTHEIGCSVLEAVEKGEIPRASYDNFLKMEKEKAYFETALVEKRKKEKKGSKIIKNYKKFIKRQTND